MELGKKKKKKILDTFSGADSPVMEKTVQGEGRRQKRKMGFNHIGFNQVAGLGVRSPGATHAALL